VTAFRLAWRNLRRNKRRNILTASALAVGLIVLIIGRGVLDGIDQQSIDNLIHYELSYLKGFAPGWLDREYPDLEYAIPDSDSLLDAIRGIDGVVAAAQRLEMTGMLIYGDEEVFARIIGVDPRRDIEVFKTLEALTSGKTMSSDQPVALVGEQLASDVGLKVGDAATLLVRSAPGALNPRTLPVAGIISTGNPEVDRFTVYLPLSLARDMALLPDSATEIAVRAEGLSSVEKLYRRLTASLPGYDWRTWKSLAEDFIQISRMKRTGSNILIGIITLVAAVGLGNTMIMSVHERTNEIGTLRALGFTPRLISGIFLWEGTLIGLTAGIIAIMIGVPIVSYFSVHGISLEAYKDISFGYPVEDAIYPMVTFGSLVTSFLFGLVLSVAASWGAARRAARGEVVRALKEGML